MTALSRFTASPLRCLAWACAMVLPLVVAVAEPAGAAVEVRQLHLGYQGYYKVGHWAPLRLILRNGGTETIAGHVEVTVPDGEGLPAVHTAPQKVHLPPGAEVETALCVRIGRHQGQLAVALRGDNRPVPLAAFDLADPNAAPPRIPLPAHDELIVVLGADIGLNSALADRHRAAASHVVQLPDDAILPDVWYAYEPVDALVLPTAALSHLEHLRQAGPRLAALDGWLRLGGRLVVCAGSQAPGLLADDTPLAQLLPARYAGAMVPLRLTRAWEGFAETDFRLEVDSLVVPRLRVQRGRVAAAEGDLPLVIRAGYGLGEVTLAAADLDQPPWSDWPGRPALASKLLAQQTGHSLASQDMLAQAGKPNRYGVTDLSGQLRAALDQFSDVRPVPFYLIACLAVAYLLLLGPVDWYLARRLARFPRWPWLSLPLVVGLFAAGTYFFAVQHKGRQLRLNQLHLVDVDVQDAVARGTTWLNLYSPATTTYDLALRPELPDGSLEEPDAGVLAWQGLAGPGLGGMQSPLAPRDIAPPYRFAPDNDRLLGLPLLQWSTRSLIARWTAPAGPWVEAELAEQADRFIHGTMTNRLGVTLRDCFLAYGPYAYSIGDFAPGQRIEISPDALSTSELHTRLTRKEIRYDEDRRQYIQAGNPYDAASLDAYEILTQMMFYDAAGGWNYSRLLNRYQNYVDLSGQLDLGRAVLVARVETTQRQAARLECDGHPVPPQQQDASIVYRFVIPVAAAPDR